MLAELSCQRLEVPQGQTYLSDPSKKTHATFGLQEQNGTIWFTLLKDHSSSYVEDGFGVGGFRTRRDATTKV